MAQDPCFCGGPWSGEAIEDRPGLLDREHETGSTGCWYRPGKGERPASLAEAKRFDITRAQALRAGGASLYEVATAVGRSKEWLREYAGLR